MNPIESIDHVFAGWDAMPDYSLETIAQTLDMSAETLQDVIQQLTAPLKQERYYHYVTRPQTGDESEASNEKAKKHRHIVLFRNPDEALSFAQKIRFSNVPRVRSISTNDIVLHLLGDSRIARLVFFEQNIAELPKGLNLSTLGDMPGVYVMDRTAVLAQG